MNVKLIYFLATLALLRRIPGPRLAEPVSELEYRPGAVVRGLAHLPVVW